MKEHFNIKYQQVLIGSLMVLALVSCEILDNDPDKHVTQGENSTYIALDEVAHILSAIPFNTAQLQEVHDAATSSSDNGYDEEYTMKNLFENPGSGVGEQENTRSAQAYDRPMRDLIRDYVRSNAFTRSSDQGDAWNPDAFLNALQSSDIQIYWPYSEQWDGATLPVVTFDPGGDADVNVGYEVLLGDDGFRHVREVVVDEEMARDRPVWVVNRNSDAGYKSLEMLRREDQTWGEGGGDIIVKPSVAKSPDQMYRMLVLKEFTMKRNYDSWFAGASEFFVKIASLDDFTASTEAELKLYDPKVTDFMIVVKRNQTGIPQNFNVMLVSEMKRHLIEHSDDCEGKGECSDDCRYAYDEYAFMITEDDGGTREDWTCKGKVYVAGKSYGIEVTIPLNTRDDIVWRGMLSGNALQRYNNKPNHFGDVDIVFEILEY